MSALTIFSALLGITGLIFLYSGFRRLLQRRFLRGAGIELSGMLLIGLSVASLLLASNLHTYQRLTYEKPVVELSFSRQGPQRYRVRIRSLDSGLQQELLLNGDEWQLDAQVLTWRGPATLLGLDASYRLHRIAGRYTNIEDEQLRRRSVYSLIRPGSPLPDTERFDLWRFAHEHRNWLDWVDAAYGSAVFLPMADGARFKVAISRTGLIARPDNAEARQAVSRWIGL